MLADQQVSWAGAITIVVVMAAVIAGSGLLVVVIANRTADGRTKRNPVAGIRTSATMSSDEAWDAAHTAGRRLTVIGGWIGVGAGLGSTPVALVLWQQRVSAETVSAVALAISLGIGTVGMLGFVVAGGVRGHRAAVEVRDRIGEQ